MDTGLSNIRIAKLFFNVTNSLNFHCYFSVRHLLINDCFFPLAFVEFCIENRQKVIEQGAKGKDIIKRLAELWRKMNDNEKSVYGYSPEKKARTESGAPESEAR